MERNKGDADQYDVTIWEDRTVLDHLAVWISRVVVRRWVALVAVVAVLFLASPLAKIGIELVQYPWLSGVWLLSLLVALLIVGYIRRIDPTTISLKALAVTFILGGAFAGFAIVVEGKLDPVINALPVVGTAASLLLVVGPVEELVKWAAVRLYAYERSGFETALDGAVYGATAGLGFAAIESAEYITQAVAHASGTGEPVLIMALGGAFGRLLPVPLHVLLTALSGYYLGLAKANPASYAPIVVKGLLIAALLHGLFDTLVTYLPGVIKFGVGFVYIVGIGVVLYRKLSRYRRQAPTGGSPTPTARS